MGAEKTLTMTQCLATLLRAIVDYAGLFPPAALSMHDAVRNYAEYQASGDAWMLGRFIVPVARLAEFESEASQLLPTDSSPWKLSALAGTNLDDDLKAISEFNSRRIGATVDTIEMKATRVEEILAAASLIPKTFLVFVEIPIDNDPTSLVQTIANAGVKAKIRTGGVTADGFPSSRELARFIRVCAENNVQFKATAGLHHPIRAMYNLTYEPNSAQGKMFGYLNVFLAAAFMNNGMQQNEAVEVLEEESADAFRFDDDGVRWRSHHLAAAELLRVRETTALSFGSCSFREPIDDLNAHNLFRR
jgi:hypothetical protein